MKTRNLILTVLIAVVVLNACGGHSNRYVNPRDTVQVPEGITGEDSIAYIEDVIVRSPISARDLLALAEVHTVEDWLYYYNNTELVERNPDFPEYAELCRVTPQDSAAMRLANRFMRMSYLTRMNGDADDMLQFAVAVNAAIDTFRWDYPSISPQEAADEVSNVVGRYSSMTQSEMNFESYVDASLDYYRTIEAYRQWLEDVPETLRSLAHEEYKAWYDLHEARFSLWRDVSYRQEAYSMKPMEIEGYYENLSRNRRAELEVERNIVLDAMPYKQLGKTVNTAQWENWIAQSSVPEDIDILIAVGAEKRIPDDSLVSERVEALRSAFAQWLTVRQAIASSLPKEQGRSYDNLTADIHSRIIGKLPPLIPLQEW